MIEEKGELTFKYKLEKGTALKSYGVYAAKLAGLPKPVIRRAEELLREYEAATGQQDEFDADSEYSELEQKLIEIDTDALSPVEALMKIYELPILNENKSRFEKSYRITRTAVSCC